MVPKQTVIVTFEGNILPAAVRINSVICPVEPYLGKVIQCFKCLKYGHVANQCRSTKTLCVSCGKEKNDDHNCSNLIFCIYCKNSLHNSTSKDCPTFAKQTTIKKIMLDRNLSFNEAREFSESSFAGSASNNRFNVLSNLSYNDEFPSLPNTHKSVRISTSQTSQNQNYNKFKGPNPLPSLNANKKRKINSPSNSPPPVPPMFPFRFGSPSKPITSQSPSFAFPPEALQAILNFVLNIFNKITSVDDIKKINSDIILKDLKLVLGDTSSSSLNSPP